MKKIVMKCLTLIAVLVTGILVLSGCSTESDIYTESTYVTAAADVETLTVDVNNRIIEIRESEDEQIHLNYFESEKEFYTIEMTDEKELSMVSTTNKQWPDYIGVNAGPSGKRILVLLPPGMIQNLTLKTSNEDLTLNSLIIPGTISVNVNNGDINIDSLDVGTKAALETKNGDIKGSIIGSYDVFSIQSDVKKGESNLPAKKETGAKALSVSANNGNIAIEFVQ